MERDLAGYGSEAYDRLLHEQFARADAVMVVNPTMAELARPFNHNVIVSPAGMDPDRFPPQRLYPMKARSKSYLRALPKN